VTLAVAVKQTADASRATWHRPSGGRHTDKSTVKEGTIRDHDTLAGVIEREGLGPASQPVLRALSRLHDPKSLRAGDRYVVSFNSEGKPIAFEYLPSAILRYVVTENTNGSWSGREERKLLAWKPVVVTGRIESSLFESVRRAGERAALAEQMIDVFAWDINFYADQHPGDRWRVLIEKQHIDNRFYRYGNLLAAEYSGKVGTFRAYAWSAGRGPVRYYDETGQAIARAFLKTPLRFVQVNSPFDRERFHPVLHTTNAHLGVDYSAPTGTPVWASASGKVIECAHKSGFGNTVVIEHGNGVRTNYYHLHKFAPGMRTGRHVRQKEMLGYVGSTGVLVGPPHLHFSVTKNGTFVDPLKMPVVRDPPVANRVAFLATIKKRVPIGEAGH
jgi:murein DD-endopeptidase MepM/ murein hydrolase activator NlpD